MVGGLAATVLLVGVLFVAVFPTRTYLTQRAATRRAEAQLHQVQADRARVKRETQRLDTPEEIANKARNDLGYVRPGEESFNILPTTTDPIGLPEVWPFTGVERALGAA
jgi:cell division protein FtsB